MNEFMMIAGMMAVTFGIRYILFALADQFEMPSLMEKALYYVPPAVLTAILVPAVLMPEGHLDFSLDNAYFYGALAALGGGILIKRNTLMASIVTGLVVFFAWRLIFG